MTILHGGDLGDNDLGARTGNVLSRGFWGGQMYGSGERGIATHVVGHEQKPPIHARHMRPRCSMIPRGESPSNAMLRRHIFLIKDTRKIKRCSKSEQECRKEYCNICQSPQP